jgi:hypothetical protein
MSEEKEQFYRMYVCLSTMRKHKLIQESLSKKDLADAVRELSPEEKAEIVTAFAEIFFDMKLETVYPAGDQLEFSFSRELRSPELPDDCGGGDQSGENEKWLDDQRLKAA